MKIPLLRRLSVRATLVIAAGLTVFAWGEPHVHRWTVGLFGLDPDTIYCIVDDSGALPVVPCVCWDDSPQGLEIGEELAAAPPLGPSLLDAVRPVFEGASPDGMPFPASAEAALMELWPDEGGPLPGPVVEATGEEVARATSRLESIALATSVLIRIAFALGLGLLVSRFVTQRVAKLSRWAANGGGDTPAPGGAGGDEIAHLGRALQAAREQNARLVADLEARDVERRAWVAQVSHDLRTPLTALIAGLDAGARQSEATPSAAGVTARFRRAKHDALRVHAFADDLLHVARLDAATPLLEEALPPGELARSGLESVSTLADELGLTLELDVAPDVPEVVGEGRLLLRVLQNLLENALRFASERVQVQIRTLEGGVRFEVRDDGPGFGAPAVRDLSSSGRCGMGLPLARRVVQRHGGSMVRSADGQSEAWVRLDLPRLGSASEDPDPGAPKTRRSREHASSRRA